MSTNLAIRDNQAEQIERVLIGGDLGRLNAEERVSYYRMVCESVGLNPLTKPFDYINLNGKLTLYAKKDATDQLRAINQISVIIAAREIAEDIYVVTARATTPAGRTDESIGAVNIGNLKGEARANAVMKAETKAKRRVTLSICGLGLLDELEVETIPSAKPPVAVTTEEIPLGKPSANGGSADKGPAATSQNGGEHVAAPAAQPEIFVEKVKTEVAAKLAKPKVEPSFVEFENCITVAQKKHFAREWEASCDTTMTAKEKERTRGEWLVTNGFVKNGKPTSALIPAAIFTDMVRVACQAAKKLKPNTHGVVIADQDVPF